MTSTVQKSAPVAESASKELEVPIAPSALPQKPKSPPKAPAALEKEPEEKVLPKKEATAKKE